MEEVTFQANGTRVAAVNTKTYIFQPEMSRGPESDLIRTINIPAVVRDTNMTTVLVQLHGFCKHSCKWVHIGLSVLRR